jgi:hypothetical protein
MAISAWLFEFATGNPKFWPVVFPPKDWIAVPSEPVRKSHLNAQLPSLGGVQ